MSKRNIVSAAASVAVLIGLLGAPVVSKADAQAELEERKRMFAEVNHRLHDEKLRAKAMEAGLERSTLCAACHGPDGNAKKSEYPNLAGQNPTYIFEQMAKFKDGRRKNFVMEALVRNFTREDKINLAVYFSSQEPKPIEGVNPRLALNGQETYNRMCVRCHGETGRGEAGFARLAGQQIDFVQITLKRFRANARKAVDFDETKRTNALMEQVTQFLTDGEIEELAHYIAMMK